MRKPMLVQTGDARCADRHRWGGEVLITFTPDAIVRVRVCSLCGCVHIARRALSSG